MKAKSGAFEEFTAWLNRRKFIFDEPPPKAKGAARSRKEPGALKLRARGVSGSVLTVTITIDGTQSDPFDLTVPLGHNVVYDQRGV